MITEEPKETSNDNEIGSSNEKIYIDYLEILQILWTLDKTIALFLTFGTIHHLFFHI